MISSSSVVIAGFITLAFEENTTFYYDTAKIRNSKNTKDVNPQVVHTH